MKNLKLNNKFQELSTDECNSIKGGWLKGEGPGGIGGTPPPITGNGAGVFMGIGMNDGGGN